ncbi:uncharacterized protein KQ657_002854 [Scheffersomyces spartinae]|uniref:Mso1 N-terminal domain-containing protein n=1 Tax=Scheffersomyces spartinae TaxID=45513 RepID=A0A9P7V5G2_9ASCO|nr:uncharacterized protein KQ657_002854 [Scheffersomyces spartinae]KAG7191718.1 hypothetical protein KQ657_002854 [Scheffersomyces spartinae]
MDAGFFSKIRSNYSQKLANISFRNSEHDGNTPDETLIHNAFVRYYDKRQLPYPEWLGVKQQAGGATVGGSLYPNSSGYSQYSSSPYQPVRASTADPQPLQQYLQQRPPIQETQLDQRVSYTRPSRLTDMYNKSRSSNNIHGQQRTLTGGGQNTTAISASKIRERMYSNSSASWKRE